jgi:hypothetical protein
MTTAVSVHNPILPSEDIIPAVKGEFYAYAAEFSAERPLYFFMKCKANKARSLATESDHLVRELDLTFIFGEEVVLCSPNSAASIGLLSGAVTGPDLQRLNETEIRPATMPVSSFHRCRERRSALALVDAFQGAGPSVPALRLSRGMTLAARTASNKYALIRVKDVAPSMCSLEACHILL